MTKSCTGSISQLKMNRPKKNDLFDVSAVPNELRLALALDNGGAKIEQREGKALVYLFGNVYTEDDAATLVIADGLNYLPTIDKDSPDYLSMPRMNGVGYVQTCATVMSAAIDANAGLTFPIGSIKGGLDADYFGKRGYSLNLVKANFSSPVLAAYNSDEGATPNLSPFNAAMSMFDWYRRHPARIAVKNKLLANFEGVAIYNQVGFKRNVNVSAEAAYKVGVPVLGGSSGNTSASTEWATDLKADAFSVAIFKDDSGKLTADVVDMPSVTDVIAKANATSKITVDLVRSGSDFTLYNRDPRTIYYVIRRLPPGLCNENWSVSAAGLAPSVGTLTMGSPANAMGTDGWWACTVPVTFRPADKMPLNVSRDVAVVLALPMNATAGAPKVSLAAEPVKFMALDKPQLARITADDKPKVVSKTVTGSDTKTSIRWSVQYQLNDGGASVDDNGLDISKLSVDCPSKPANFVVPLSNADIRSVGSIKVVDLTLNGEWNGDFTTAEGLNYTPCTLTGDLVFTLRNGAKVTKPFPDLTFQYPVATGAPKTPPTTPR